MKNGSLYLVPTPIGNLSDMTFRAVEVLAHVSVIACEDTRTSHKLLAHYDIKTPTLSYHQHNEKQRAGQLIQKLLGGDDVAIISDAGSPGISDPSQEIVNGAVAAGVTICPLPGATALVPAVTAAGITASRFVFMGFLPDKANKRNELINSIQTLPWSSVWYEAPHRILKFLAYMHSMLGDRQVCIAREISKLHESWYRGTLRTICNDDITIKGEFVVVIAGYTHTQMSEVEIEKLLSGYQGQGISKKNAIKKVVSEYGIAKNKAYEISLKISLD